MFDFLNKGEEITTLRQEIKMRRYGNLSNGVLFLQDNVLAHKSHIAMQTNPDLRLELVEHLHYTSDLASSDYHAFPQLKKSLKSSANVSDRSCGGLVCKVRYILFINVQSCRFVVTNASN